MSAPCAPGGSTSAERHHLGEHRDQQRAGRVRLLGDRREVDAGGRRTTGDCTTTQEVSSSIAARIVLGARRVRRQRHDRVARPCRDTVSTTLAVVRMQAAGEHRLAPLGDAVRHQHRLGGRRSSRRTWRRWRPPCRSGSRPGSGTRTGTAACPARSRAGRACRRSGTPSAGSGDRRSPAHGAVGAGADEERHRAGRRRSAPPCRPRMRSTSSSLLRRAAGRGGRRAACRRGCRRTGRRSSRRRSCASIAGAVGLGVGEIAHQKPFVSRLDRPS